MRFFNFFSCTSTSTLIDSNYTKTSTKTASSSAISNLKMPKKPPKKLEDLVAQEEILVNFDNHFFFQAAPVDYVDISHDMSNMSDISEGSNLERNSASSDEEKEVITLIRHKSIKNGVVVDNELSSSVTTKTLS